MKSAGVYGISGQNIAGRAEVIVKGTAGSQVVLRYGEILDAEGILTQENINTFVMSGEFQTERYALSGKGLESWHSHFTYHGFRYVKLEMEGDVEVVSLTAQAIHSDVPRIGGFTSSDSIMNALGKCTCWSYLNNLVGVPTDCPHREKNGWLNDTQLASDTGLFMFDGTETYREWIGTIRDCMRPNGEVPGIAPTAGWGFNWGNGPMMDAAMFGIPRAIYIYRGDASAMHENYGAFKQALNFTATLAKGNIVRYGLGDWCHPYRDKAVVPEVPLTGWYYHNLMIFAEAAELFGNADDAQRYSDKALQGAEAFNANFSNGNGSYANNEDTALAVALNWGFCQGEERRKAVEILLQNVRRENHVANFGIVGAKFVPRVLAENGFADDAFKIFTQTQFPGWGKWVKDGETTLCEDFAQKQSHNHIMFGDLVAWMMQYAAGIEPSFERPGFRDVVLAPCPVTSLTHLDAWYDSVYGRISVAWKRQGNRIRYTASIPDGIHGHFKSPDGGVSDFDGTLDTVY